MVFLLYINFCPLYLYRNKKSLTIVSTNSITNTQEYQYKWCGTTVAGILDRQEYIGDTVNFKYTVRSYTRVLFSCL